MAPKKKDVRAMLAEVVRLTGGKLPDSDSEKYISSQLRSLKKRVVVSMSFRKADELALGRVAKEHGTERHGGRPRRDGGTTNLSALVRAALAEYARKRGFDAEAALLEEGAS